MKIVNVSALEILDSRGFPTVEAFVEVEGGIVGKAAVPSGASTGEREAVELRDGDPKRYFGKGVLQAVANVNGPLREAVVGKNVTQQAEIDGALLSCDGTENKSRLGANAILAISLASARSAALALGKPLYRYLAGENEPLLPLPMMNIINGGVHADSGLAYQEFLIRPIGALSFAEGLRYASEVFHTLKKILKGKGLAVSVGDEGGFAPKISSHEQALDLILEAIEKAGYKAGKDISLAIDCAASEFYESGKYNGLTTDEMISSLEKLAKSYPIDSIEDPLDQNDWAGWQAITERLGGKIQIIADDLLVTNPQYLKRGIKEKSANAILIKPNQIGTLTETLETIRLAKASGWKTVLSHRSGETEDTFIADLAVGASLGQIKTGSLSRSERIAKYNRLLEIEAELSC